MTEIASQTAPAVIEESAPSQIEEQIAGSAESAPVAEEPKVETPEATPEPTEEKESESKAVRELQRQRKERRKAERDAAYWRGVAEARAQVTPQVEAPKEQELVKPKLEDFPDDYEAFERAKEEYLEAKLEKKIEAKLEKKYSSRDTQANEDKVQKDFVAMIETEAEKNPDFPDIVKDMGDRITPAMGRVIMESDISSELILYFHNNPKVEKELSKLSEVSPLSAARRLGSIEQELKSKPKPEPPKKVSSAPEPISTVKATGPAGIVDDDDLPIDEYIKRKNEKQFGARKR